MMIGMLIRSQSDTDRRREAGELSEWAVRAYAELCDKVADEAFPCTFGTTALKQGEILFAFIEATEEPAVIDELVGALTEYAEFVASQSIVRASMQPLAILMLPPPAWGTVEAYYDNSWRLLAAVHERDPAPWPARVPADPDSPDWSFCFGGVPLFINFKTPRHRRRRSRRTAHCYLWLVQARDGFDVVAGDTVQGRHARHIIRDKLEAYDRVPTYPALGHYGAPENREWKQYFVPETNEPLGEECPFRAVRRKRIEKPLIGADSA